MITRFLNKRVKDIIENQVSFLVLGPRQTGKTTFIKELFREADYLEYNFMESRVRRRFEQDPSLLIDEIEGTTKRLVFIDEVQKVPEVLDNVQVIIDRGNRIFAITGSSARKLKRKGVNLLPGRIVEFRMDALFWEEYREGLSLRGQETIKNILKFGELPRIFTLVSEGKQEIAVELLYSYVNTYLEEEIRSESLVRRIGDFNKFLKLAAEESGRIVSFRNLSQDLGIPHPTISQYYQILVDCLIVEEIDALVPASQRGKTLKSSKWVFFDTGVANAAAEVLGPAEYLSEYWGNLFEQWVGLTILKYIKINGIKADLYYWRDYNGREIDWVIEYQGRWLPVEVKWADTVKNTAAKHIEYFLDNFPKKASQGYIIFTGTNTTRITERVMAVPYFDLVQKVLVPFLV